MAVLAGFVLSTPAPVQLPDTSTGVPLSIGDILRLPATGLGPFAVSPTATASPSTSSATVEAIPVVAGPPAQGPGIIVVATPLADGSMSVTETATFTQPQYHLVLRPPQVAYAGTRYRGLSPVAGQIQLVVDGNMVDLGSQPLTSSRTLDFGSAGALRIELRYVLTGAIVERTAAGGTMVRTAVFQPLLSGSTQAVPVSYVVGGAVTSITCPQLSVAHQSCDPKGGSVGLLSGLNDDQSLVIVALAPVGPTSPVLVVPGGGATGSGSGDPVTSTPDPTTTTPPSSEPTTPDPTTTPTPSTPVTETPEPSGTPEPTTPVTSEPTPTDDPPTDTSSSPTPTDTGTPGVPVLPDPGETTPVPEDGPTSTSTDGPSTQASLPEGSDSSASSSSSDVEPTASADSTASPDSVSDPAAP